MKFYDRWFETFELITPGGRIDEVRAAQ